MTCNNCMCAKGKIIKMCDIFNAPCYDPYSNIDKCKNWACKYYKTIEIEGSATNGDKKVKLCK